MLPWQSPSLPSSAGAELKSLTDIPAAKAVPGLLLRNGMLLGFASHGTAPRDGSLPWVLVTLGGEALGLAGTQT